MMKSIKTPLWDAIWIWNGLPIGLLLIALVWLQQSEILYYLFALGIILETGHLISSAVVAWSNSDFRCIMVADPFQYVVLPIGIAVLCVGIGAATAAGWTSYQGGLHSIYRITDWHNPLPILVWGFWLSVGWHFSMQNFGIVRLYRSRCG